MPVSQVRMSRCPSYPLDAVLDRIVPHIYDPGVGNSADVEAFKWVCKHGSNGRALKEDALLAHLGVRLDFPSSVKSAVAHFDPGAAAACPSEDVTAGHAR